MAYIIIALDFIMFLTVWRSTMIASRLIKQKDRLNGYVISFVLCLVTLAFNFWILYRVI